MIQMIACLSSVYDCFHVEYNFVGESLHGCEHICYFVIVEGIVRHSDQLTVTMYRVRAIVT